MILERIYLPSVEQSNAINCAADRQATRKTMAAVYADCIIADRLAAQRPDGDRVDFAKVNAAIVARWPRGLLWIKTRAWKLLESMKQHSLAALPIDLRD